jgi:predicted protein tyrosine phosphatase
MLDSDEVLDEIWLGTCPSEPADLAWLARACGVQAVLNVQTEHDMDRVGFPLDQQREAFARAGLELRWVPIVDLDDGSLRERLVDAVRELAALVGAGRTVYVHCTAGFERSPSVVAAYLAWCRGFGGAAAIALVMERRACCPNAAAIEAAGESWTGERISAAFRPTGL